MDTELKNRLDSIERKIDTINKNVKTVKNIFLWTFILTILVIVIPMIALYFVIPNFLSGFGISSSGNSADYTNLLNSLGI